MKTIISKETKDFGGWVRITLDKKTHEKLNKIVKQAETKKIKLTKLKLCRLIIENNIDEVIIK